MPVPVTFSDLRPFTDVASQDERDARTAANKRELLLSLSGKGFPSLSWEDGAVPLGLVEIQAEAKTESQAGQQIVAEEGLNSFATGESLTLHSDETYDNQRQTGVSTVGYVTLTDASNAGPIPFFATAMSASVGVGGTIVFDGVADALTGSTQVTIPRSGSRDVIVMARGSGAAWNVAAGTINVIARGGMTGVTVTNPSDWLSKYAGSRQGVDPEKDDKLRTRNTSRWATPGAGSPAKAYTYWAMTADEQVTKAEIVSNYDIFDPGRVDVIVAGAAGPVGAGVVSNVQNYIAAQQVGGDRIPETARAVVSSALGVTVTITATIYVQGAFNTAAFQATIAANVSAFFADLRIGALVSRERLIQVLLSPAGLSAGVITDATITAPPADVQLAFNEVAVPSLSLTYVGV